jgi:hypothetical protein
VILEARALVLVLVLVLESGRAEWWSGGALQYWSIGVLE